MQDEHLLMKVAVNCKTVASDGYGGNICIEQKQLQ